MEGIVLFVGFLLLAVLCGPWIGLAILRNRFRTLDQRMEDRLSNLTQRVFSLETTIREFKRTAAPATSPPPAPKAEPVPATEPPVVAHRHEVTVPPPVVIPPQTIQAPPPPPPLPSTPPTPTFASSELDPAISARIEKEGGLEELLGKNWLNKLGIILLVLGIAFFLAYQLKTLGPAGKVFVGYAVSFALLIAGIWFERSDRYRVLARAGIAGGWALLFFTTYAMYHVPAARVLSSQSTDLVLMLIVALAMVWHTLRYESQVVTGLAFLLAYSTVFISHVNVYSLSAGVVLAIGIVLITLRRNWFELEVFGILGSYLNHYFWLRPIIEPMGNRVEFPEFFSSVAILVCYWIIYRVSYVVRTVESESQESVSALSALLNTILILGLLKYQAVHPEWAFWALLVGGVVELALGHLPITKRRRTAFVVLSTIGAVLLVAAIPFRYSGAQVSVIWLFEAEALFLIGLWTKEILFARLGLLAAFATAGQILVSEAARVFERRVTLGDLTPDYRVGLLVVGVAALVFYANVHYFSRSWPARFEREVDRQLLTCCSYVAALLALVGLWMAFPELWTAVAWSALAVVLFEIGIRQRISELRWQSYFAFLCVFLRVCFINLNADPTPGEFSTRAYTILLVTGTFFYCGARHPIVAGLANHEGFFLAAQSWMGAITLAALIRLELPADWVITGWALLTFGLMAIASRVRHPILKYQAGLLSGVIFLRAFAHNFPERSVTPWSPASLNVIYASALMFGSLFFAFHIRRQENRGPNRKSLGRFIKAEQLLFFVPLTMITILLALEMRSGLITVSWGIEAVVVFLFALWVGERSYRLSGLVLLLLCVGKIVIIDVWGLDPRDRYITFIVMGLAVLLVSFLYTRFSETIKKFLSSG